MAACQQIRHGHIRIADNPRSCPGTACASHQLIQPSRRLRRNSRHCHGRSRGVVACQAPQQQRQRQQQPAIDDTHRQRKLGRFNAKADIRRSLLNFRYEAEVDAGMLVIQPISAPQLREVTDLLTDVFEAGVDPIGLYTRWMRGQIRQYLEHHIKVAPDAVVLVALLLPHRAGSDGADSRTAGAAAAQAPGSSDNGSTAGTVTSQADTSDTPADPQQQQPAPRRSAADEGVLVGTVEMSFTDSTRTRFLTLNPPTDSAYLGNMCTAPGHRRRGYGSHLLRAAERLTQLAGYPGIYLHLRFRDTEAAAMYERAGYIETKRDMFLLPLVGFQRRFLMRKDMPHQQARG